MIHKKRIRAIIGEPRYNKIYQDIQEKIIKIAGLSYAALPLVNDVLWDTNPTIIYDDDFNKGSIAVYSLGKVFTTLEEYIKLFDKKETAE